nr:YdeI/OmpD-associated family protein [Pedobacter mongoliensis]
MEIPSELEKEFEKHPGSGDFFFSLSKSAKKMILTWIALAKRPQTRENRIKEVAELAAQRLKPKQFR